MDYFLEEDIIKKYLEIPSVEGLKLYHYTSPHTLWSIMQDPCLHFTNSKFFLDKSEIVYAYGVLKEAISKVGLNKEFKEMLLAFCEKHDLEKAFFEDDGPKREPTQYYVFSLSRKKDDLFMWNSYTKTENHHGYSIEIDIRKLLDSDLKFGACMYGMVDYDRKSQVESFLKILEDFDEEISKLEKDQYYYKKFYHVLNEFKDLFECKAALMKDDCFQAENEFRIILYSDETLDWFHSVNDSEIEEICGPVKLCYKESSGILMPYMKVPIDLKNLVSIMPSPYMEREQACEGLEHFAKTHSIEFKVKSSRIPFLKRIMKEDT